MCMTCLSAAELTVMQGTAVGFLAKGALARAHDFVTGRPAGERQLEAHLANSEFLRGMGLDPVAVLGPAPAVADAKVRVPRRAPAVSGPAFAPAGG